MSYRVGDQPIPGYQLAGLLGEGGFGAVWKANGPGRIPVALKIISLGRKQGLKEFKALALIKSIHHPNLVPIHSFWLKDENGDLISDVVLDPSSPEIGEQPSGGKLVGEPGAPRAIELLIAMGLGEKTLSDRLEECQQAGMAGIPLPELLDYMESAGRAIDFLNSPRHDLGNGTLGALQHCDIKPQNMVIVGGDVQVCDFGLVRALGDIRMTSAGVSVAYGSPECIAKNPPSSSTDQYSLAISYVELRSGSLPFEDPDSLGVVINSHLSGDLDLSRLLPRERAIIRRATALDPANRFANVLQMVRALRDNAREDPSESSPPQGGDFKAGPPGGTATKLAPQASASVAHTKTWRMDLDDTSPNDETQRRKSRFGDRRLIAATIALSLTAVWALVKFRPSNQGQEPAVAGMKTFGSNGRTARNPIRLVGKRRTPAELLKQTEEHLAAAKRLLKTEQVPQLAEVVHEAERADQLLRDVTEQKLDAADQRQASDLGRQSLVLKIRARSRQLAPDQAELQREVDSLSSLLSSAVEAEGMPLTRCALEPLLVLISSTEAKQEDYDWSLPLLGSTLRALVAAGAAEDDWSATATELSSLEEAKERVVERVFKALDGLTDRPADALDLCERLTVDLPLDPRLLYRRAVLEIRRSKFTEAAENLQSVVDQTPGSAPAEVADLLSAVQAVLAIGGVQVDSTQLEAMLKAADDRIAQMPLELKYEYADRLLRLVGSGRDQAAAALHHIAQLLPKLPPFEQRRNELERRFQLLEQEGAERERLVLRLAIEAPSPDFAQLSERLAGVKPDGTLLALVRLARVECLLENKMQHLETEDVAFAESVFADPELKVDPLDHFYMLYVKALFLASKSKSVQQGEAAGLIIKALAADNRPKYFGTRRLAHCTDILCAAVTKRITQRAADATGRAPAQWLDSPFGDTETAQTEFEWLQKAGSLAPLSPDLQLHKALAAVNKREPDLIAARKALKELPAGAAPPNDNLSAIPQWLLRAQVQTESRDGRLAAIDAYWHVLQILQGATKKSVHELPPLILCATVVDPAIECATIFTGAKEVTPQQAQAIAHIFTAKGTLLRTHRSEDWRVANVVAASMQAFDAALTFAPIAEAFAGRGWCHMHSASPNRSKTKEDLAKAEADAESAIKTDPRYAFGYNLKSNILIEESRSGLVAAKRAALLEIAVNTADKAIVLSSDDPIERAYARINRSLANVELVNFAANLTQDAQRKRLEDAIADAGQAIKAETLYQQYAFDSLGNALEDLAWIARYEPKKNYEAAIAAFESAVTEGNQGKSRSLMNLGRCRFKAVSCGGLPDELLDMALEELRKGEELEPRRAEIFYWRGQIYAWQAAHMPADASEKRYKIALGEFEHCLEADDTNHPATIGKAQCCLALEKWAEADEAFEAALNTARAIDMPSSLDYLAQWAQSVPATPGDRLAALTAAEKRVAAVVPQDLPEPLMFAGVVLQAEGQWDDAIAHYTTALAKPPGAGKRDYSVFLHLRASEAGYLQLVALHGQNGGAAKAHEHAKKTGHAIIQHAATAAVLAKSQKLPIAQAAATYQAALSSWTVGEYTDKRELRAAALDKFREAIQLAPKHKNAGLWRLVYVVHWDNLSTISQTADLKEAIRLLDEASHMPLPKDKTPELIKTWLKEMNDRLQKKVPAAPAAPAGAKPAAR